MRPAAWQSAACAFCGRWCICTAIAGRRPACCAAPPGSPPRCAYAALPCVQCLRNATQLYHLQAYLESPSLQDLGVLCELPALRQLDLNLWHYNLADHADKQLLGVLLTVACRAMPFVQISTQGFVISLPAGGCQERVHCQCSYFRSGAGDKHHT